MFPKLLVKGYRLMSSIIAQAGVASQHSHIAGVPSFEMEVFREALKIMSQCFQAGLHLFRRCCPDALLVKPCGLHVTLCMLVQDTSLSALDFPCQMLFQGSCSRTAPKSSKVLLTPALTASTIKSPPARGP